MYNVQQVNAGNSDSRVKALQDAMAGIAIEQKPTFYDGLAEAVRLGGEAYRGKCIFEAIVTMRCMAAKNVKELLSDIKKDLTDG